MSVSMSSFTPSTGNAEKPNADFCSTTRHVKNAPESQPEIKRRGSVLHFFKKKLHTSHKTLNPTDPEYENITSNFEKLTNNYQNLRVHLTNYVAHVRGVFVTSNAVASDFVLGIDDNNAIAHALGEETVSKSKGLAYTNMIGLVSDAHDNKHAVEAGALAERLEKSCIAVLEKHLKVHSEIFERMKVRQTLRNEVDYYIQKVDKLGLDKIKEHVVSEKEKHRFDRNQRKLEECRAVYNQHNTALLQDLKFNYNLRIAILGHTLSEFVDTEAKLTKLVAASSVTDETAIKDMQDCIQRYNANIDLQSNHKFEQIAHLKEPEYIQEKPSEVFANNVSKFFSQESFGNELAAYLKDKQWPSSDEIDRRVVATRPKYPINEKEYYTEDELAALNTKRQNKNTNTQAQAQPNALNVAQTNFNQIGETNTTTGGTTTSNKIEKSESRRYATPESQTKEHVEFHDEHNKENRPFEPMLKSKEFDEPQVDKNQFQPEPKKNPTLNSKNAVLADVQ